MPELRKGLQNIKTLLSREQTEIIEAAFFLMLPNLLTKATGLLFNLIAASTFGTKDKAWEHFLLASSLPDMLTNVIIAGTIGSIVIPILVSSKRDNKMDSFLRLYSSLLNYSIIILSFFAILIAALADLILPFFLINVVKIAPENLPTPTELTLIANMLRVLLVPQIILGVSTFISNGLNVYNRFLVPQLAPLFFNFGRILGILVLVPLLNRSPWAIVLGVLIGSAFHLAVQLPLARSIGLKYMPVLDTKDPRLKETFRMGLPRIVSLGLENLALTFNDFISFSIRGGIAAYNYANQISLFVPQIFAFTFAYASFPKLSEHFEDNDQVNIKYIIKKSLNQIFFLVIPIVVTILVLRVPLVRLFFGLLPKTRLDLDGTYQIAWVLLMFAFGHIFICGKWFMYRVFYAAKDTVTPLIVSTISFILSILLTISFTNIFSHNANYSLGDTKFTLDTLFTRGEGAAAIGGVGIGISIAYSLEFILLLLIFNYTRLNIGLRGFVKSVVRKLFAGFVMMIVMYGIFRIWSALNYALPDRAALNYAGSTTLNLLILTVITVIPSFLVYYFISVILKVEEVKTFEPYLKPILKLLSVRQLRE